MKKITPIEKTVYIVTPGDKDSGANPGMNHNGFAQVKALRPLLPPGNEIPMVICGTGRRHKDVYNALDLVCRPTFWTASVGGPESLEKAHGQDMVILADGTPVTRASYTTTDDGMASMQAVLNSAPDNSVICSGRPSMIMLGKKDARSAAVYRITFESPAPGNPGIKFEGTPVPALDNLEIQEIRAAGVAEAGTV